MEKNRVSGMMLTLLLTSMLTLALNIQPVRAEPRTWYVDDSGGVDFARIQDAINAASPGDTVYVYSGTYYESVVLNKTVLLVGENKDATVIDGSGTDTVVRITADNSLLRGFTVRDGGGLSWPPAGVFINSSQAVTVEGNIIADNPYGILLFYSQQNTIKDNVVSRSSQFGLYSIASTQNMLSGNTVEHGSYAGVFLQDSGSNTLRDNKINENWLNFGVDGYLLSDYLQDIDASNTVNGKPIYYLINQENTIIDDLALPNAGYLAIVNCTNVVVRDMILSNNYQGLLLAFTASSTVENVRALDNMIGIYLVNSVYNNFTGNTLSHLIFGFGMQLQFSMENRICENTFANMSYGIYLFNSNNNIIYHNNFVNNREQAVVYQSNNTWDDGYPSGGNHWSDYAGLDADGDGIGDTPYLVDENNQDYYPLMEPWTPPPKVATLVAPYILDDNLVPGSIFRINITVADVQNLHGYQFVLSYDTNILTAVDFGLYLPFKTFWPSEINDEAGYAALAAFTYAGDWYGLTTIDPVPVAWIEFLVDNRGLSVLDMHGPFDPYGNWEPTSVLANVYGEEIEHVDVDGFFDNRISAVTATPHIYPGTLNLRSMGQWITAYVQLPEGYDATDINATTIVLNGTVSPVLDPKYDFVTNASEYLVDHNNDGILERMVKFDRAAIESFIYDQGIRYGEIALALTGNLSDGTPFEGTGVIFVNYAGDVNNDGKIDILDAAAVSAHWYPGPPAGLLGYGLNADLNKDGAIDILDSGIVSSNWGQTVP